MVEEVPIFDSRQNKILYVDKIRKTDAEWKKSLTPEQYKITTERSTEQPFTCTFHILFPPSEHFIYDHIIHRLSDVRMTLCVR